MKVAQKPNKALKTVNLNKPNVDFDTAKSLADAKAAEQLKTDTICLSWYNTAADKESPAYTNLCKCGDEPGYAEYALNRGAALKVTVNTDDYIFYYRLCDDN